MMASIFGPGDARQDGVKLTGDKAHILRNNIGFPNDNQYIDAATYGTDSQFNTWDLGITPKVSDFLITTDTSVDGKGLEVETTSLALGPRQADGSLPNVDFLKLAAGSQMIDKGMDVGLPAVGKPDLGAYEYGATGGSATGGVTGTGVATGSGGATATGGKTASGGAPGTGGTTVVGGTTATGGNTVLGGAPGTGGDTGAGGVTDTGGVVDLGGTAETGGMDTGGRVDTGGQVATGGLSGGAGKTGSVDTGGSTGVAPQPGSTGGATTSTAAAQTSGGCSCRIAGRQIVGYPGFVLLGLLVFALRLRRKR
jgi:hypothetical protein